MPSDDVELVICCANPDELSTEDRPAGAVISTCARCQAAILLSPTSQEQLAAGGALALCTPCWIESMGQQQEVEMRLMPGQVEEFNRATHKTRRGGDVRRRPVPGDGEPKA